MSTNECCLKGVKDSGTATGSITQIAGVRVYVAEPLSFDGKSVIHLTDAFGSDFINNQLICDDYAKGANVRVYMPDLFGAEPVPNNIMEDPAKRAEFNWGAWVGRHLPDVVLKEIVVPLVKEVREKQGVKKIAAIGFCYGGVVALRLSATGLVDAVATAHPSIVKVPEDIENVKVTSLWLFSEIDPQFKPEVIETTKKIIEAKSLYSEFHVFLGMEHGFAARGRSCADPNVAEQAADASKKAIKFFNEHL